MLKAGALLSEYLHEDWEPLAMAWIYGPDAAVKILQEEGDKEVLVREGGHKIDRVSMVLAHNPEVMPRFLISLGRKIPRGSTVIPMGDGFSTMLMNDAVTFWDIKVVKFLIEHFPDIINGEDQEDSCFRPPMVQAAFHKHEEIVHLLLDAGANPNISESAGQTALYLCCEEQ